VFEMNITRSGSSAYWDSEAWNPDERVYVGASDGQTHHLHAVSSDDAAPGDGYRTEPTTKANPGERGQGGDYWDAFETAAPARLDLHQLDDSLRAKQGLAGGNFLSDSASRDGSSYWDEYRSSGAGRQSAPSEKKVPEKQEKDLKRVNSGAYWDAEQWDPDQRVYVGAEAGMQNHLQAVDPTKDEVTVWRAWAGGLSSQTLGHDGDTGPLIDLRESSADAKVKLEDLYEVLEESVGCGSFGVVRRCRHKGSGRTCVIKSVRKDAAGERYRALLVDRHLGEKLLWMSKEAQHPNIATYLDMLEGPQHFFVVMEELAGAELMEQVEECFPVTEAYLQRVMKQILSALSHLHNKVCLVHRDVKLSNFRFRNAEDSANLALLDFGFATSTSEPWDGAVCGTLMFMAPEVLGSTAATPHLAAMDVWAAGVILYVLLTGDSPAQEDEVRVLGRGGPPAEAVLEKALSASQLRSASAESLNLLKQLLVLDPSQRITAEEALRHDWFHVDGSVRKVDVPAIKYQRQRSASRGSEVSTPTSAKREKTPKKLDLPQPAFTPLERIVSEGAEEIKD
ncbi:unnamed protein product, partial [Effrenium voratum]